MSKKIERFEVSIDSESLATQLPRGFRMVAFPSFRASKITAVESESYVKLRDFSLPKIKRVDFQLFPIIHVDLVDLS